ncbi:FMN reductase [Halobacteriales archaeon QH_6_64_20]|jgi:NAD(P)H-dependent FMN reductase|nr:MAG: FMN reductase [Halobacteriales archaeon QH_6_64_20]
MARTHVVGVVGSLRDDSYARRALSRALNAAEESGATTDLLDLREYDLSVFDPDREDPVDATRLTEAIEAGDAVVLATPVYHGSYSSPLKLALDYCGFDEFEDTTVGLLAVAGGGFPVTALEHLRSVCRALNAWVLPHQAAIPRARNAFENGALVDEDIADRVDTLGERAVEFAHIEPDPPCPESLENVGAHIQPDR